MVSKVISALCWECNGDKRENKRFSVDFVKTMTTQSDSTEVAHQTLV